MGHEFDMNGKVAIITGGSKGLGRAMALGLAKAGANIVVSSRKIEPCEVVAQEVRELGRRALAVSCHVGDWVSLPELIDKTLEEFGRIDVLINNAGIAPVSPNLLDLSESLFDKTMDVNLKGPLRLTALAAEAMKRTGGGTIINISSLAAQKPRPYTVVYSAAKAGLNVLTAAAAQEYAADNIRVNCIVCGMFRTDSFSKSIPTEESEIAAAQNAALKRIADPDEIVGTALYLASNASSYTTGECIVVDGGALK
jgi:NAD(P)-dependent dehydrogenase (short-subunit alcohol dehydrogenase family)